MVLKITMSEDFFTTVVSSEDYICGNSFIELTDFTNIQFCKIDNVSEFRDRQFKYFITHNGDYDVNENTLKFGPKCEKWFCQNKNVNNSNLISIPIGLENFEPEFSAKSNFGRFSSLPKYGPQKKEYISYLSSNTNEHKNLVYMNFNTTTYASERNYVKSVFANKKWVTKEENVDWKLYYNSLANSKFCFSPRGNGIDCHRTWEALYLRTIPILKKGYFMEEFSDLPILFVDDWLQINQEFLENKYEQIKEKQYNLEKLSFSYWKKIIYLNNKE